MSDTKFTSDDKFENPHEKFLANTPTVTDANGVERIVGSSTDVFIPAPTEASKAEIEAAERRNRMFSKASKDRQALLKGEVKEADKAVNDPSQGGSQSVTQTQGEFEAKRKQAEQEQAKKGTDADKSVAAEKTKETNK